MPKVRFSGGFKNGRKENGKELLRRMVHGRLFVFLYCRCINSYLNKTKRKLLFKSFLYSMKWFQKSFYIKQGKRIVKTLNKTYIELWFYIKCLVENRIVLIVSLYKYWRNAYFLKDVNDDCLIKDEGQNTMTTLLIE